MKFFLCILTVLMLTSCNSIPRDGHRHVLHVESVIEQDLPRHAPQRYSPDAYCPVGHHNNNWC